MPIKIVIVDFGMGNLFSVRKKLSQLNAHAIVSSSPNEIESADKIILPGVGHFGKAMENLSRLNLTEPLATAVLIKKKPVLGICLGMQLMVNHSEEGNAKGLGWIDADVLRIRIKNTVKYKVPQIGWNSISKTKESGLMKNIPENAEFYFVHSYFIQANDRADVLNETTYETTYTSAIEIEHIFGVQYHPEKSHDAGTILLNNFIRL